MKKLLLLILLPLFTFSCNRQVKPIGDEPLNMEQFPFDTEISDLLPEKNKSKDYKNIYDVKGALDSQIIEIDTTYIDNFSEINKAIGIEYRQLSSSSIDRMAVFKNQNFNRINIATTLEGKIKVINAVSSDLTEQQSEDLLKKLVNKYGNPKKLINKWNEELFIYEWTTKSKIVRFVSAYDDESATMRLTIDKKKQTISFGEKKPHYVGYLFIINPALKEEVFGKMKRGDFLYLDEKSE